MGMEVDESGRVIPVRGDMRGRVCGKLGYRW